MINCSLALNAPKRNKHLSKVWPRIRNEYVPLLSHVGTFVVMAKPMQSNDVSLACTFIRVAIAFARSVLRSCGMPHIVSRRQSRTTGSLKYQAERMRSKTRSSCVAPQWRVEKRSRRPPRSVPRPPPRNFQPV